MESSCVPVPPHPVDDLSHAQVVTVHLVDAVDGNVGLKTTSDESRNAVPHNLPSRKFVLARTALLCREQTGCLPPPNPVLILLPKLVEISWHGG